MEKDKPLNGKKYNENNKDSQMGQVTTKKNCINNIRPKTASPLLLQT